MIFPFIKYKQQKEPCIAKGPTIQWAHRCGSDFKHSPFSIALPDSNAKLYEPDRSPSPARVGFGWYDYETADPIKRWSGQGFLTREYRFWGPRGIGRVSRMSSVGWFARIRKPKEGVSLFHPRAFEFHVIDYIEDRFINYPKEWYEGQPRNIVRAPIDWQTFDHLPGPTAFFNVDTGTSTAPNYYFVTAIDDADLLFLGFRLRPNFTGPKHIPPEEWVDQRNMKQLMFDIFHTLEVELSPEAEARRLQAIKDLDDTSLKKTMETHSFTYKPEDNYQEKSLSKGK